VHLVSRGSTNEKSRSADNESGSADDKSGSADDKPASGNKHGSTLEHWRQAWEHLESL